MFTGNSLGLKMAAFILAHSSRASQRCLCRLQTSSIFSPKLWNARESPALSFCSWRYASAQKTQVCNHLKWFARRYHIDTAKRLYSATNPSNCISASRCFKHQSVHRPELVFIRRMTQSSSGDQRNKSAVLYICAVGVFMVGMAYAGVPLYRIFCQATGRGGQATQGHDVDKVETMNPVKDRQIRIRFNADVSSSMQWNFRPEQREVKVVPGETALAFYSAKNPTAKPIIGISTYNVVPFEAGQYFNKIQCFCFEEQRLNPHEQVDMPVFFYIDPEFADDPKMDLVDTIILSYTFFEAKDGMQLPLPGYTTPQMQPS